MARYIIRKLLHVVAVLLIVTFALAFLVDLAEGDPAYAILGDQATPEQVHDLHVELGLDDPVYERYGRWLGDVVQFDFGTSYSTQEPVTDLIKSRLPVTAELVFLALLMALVVSIPIGVYTAYKADGRFDRIWQMISSLLISFPAFVLALVFVYVFSIQLKDFPVHFPATGWVKITDNPSENLWYVFLPALTLALAEIPAYTRLLRADMIATLQEDYILAARAKGMPTRRILFRHALRPSSFSLITLAALSTGRLIGGAVIVETLFALPGLGQLLVTSVTGKDILVVQGVVMFVAIMWVVINSLLDVAYHLIDPRVRIDRASV